MLCTRKEFENLCAFRNPGEYPVYRKRGKIFEQIDKDGNIVLDTEHPINKDFMRSRQTIIDNKRREEIKRELIPEPELLPSPKNAPKKAPKPKISEPVSGSKNSENQNTGSKYELELQKLQVEIKQKEVATALNEQKLATILGNNIPGPIVSESIAKLAKSLLQGYKNYIDQEITQFCHKHKIEDKARIDLSSKLITGLNATHTKAVNEARLNMKNELKKYKITNSMSDESDND